MLQAIPDRLMYRKDKLPQWLASLNRQPSVFSRLHQFRVKNA